MGVICFIIAALAVTLLVWYVMRKLKHGGSCCGGHESAPEKIKPKDRKLSNYPYRYIADVEGMVCSNCLRRVENAFNTNEGIYARGRLDNKRVSIYSKRELTRREAVGMLDSLSYTITDFREERK